MGIVRKKAGIIGVGKVGATLAFYLAVEHICDDLLLIGRNAEKTEAEALDLQHSLGYSGNNISIRFRNYADCGDRDAIVRALAAPYHTGMTRSDMI